jgi:hypothetical protein
LVNTVVTLSRLFTQHSRGYYDNSLLYTTNMRGDKIHTPENDLHRIFVKDIEDLMKQLSNYLADPYPTDELLQVMEEYSERWAEACTKVYMHKYRLDTNY